MGEGREERGRGQGGRVRGEDRRGGRWKNLSYIYIQWNF